MSRVDKIFLIGVIQQSQNVIDSIKKLTELRSSYNQKLREKKASRSVITLTEHLFANPIVTVPAASRYLGITYAPAKTAIRHLQEYGILEEMDGRVRNKMYVAGEIMKLFATK